MSQFREKFGEANVFLEKGPTQRLTRLRASFSLRERFVRATGDAQLSCPWATQPRYRDPLWGESPFARHVVHQLLFLRSHLLRCLRRCLCLLLVFALRVITLSHHQILSLKLRKHHRLLFLILSRPLIAELQKRVQKSRWQLRGRRKILTNSAFS
jgi:hypothetical protein